MRLCMSLHWMPRLSATINCWKRYNFSSLHAHCMVNEYEYRTRKRTFMSEKIRTKHQHLERTISMLSCRPGGWHTWTEKTLSKSLKILTWTEDVKSHWKYWWQNYMQDCWSPWVWSVWQCGARSVEETGNSTSGRGTQESHQNIRGGQSQVPPRSRHHGSVQTP